MHQNLLFGDAYPCFAVGSTHPSQVSILLSTFSRWNAWMFDFLSAEFWFCIMKTPRHGFIFVWTDFCVVWSPLKSTFWGSLFELSFMWVILVSLFQGGAALHLYLPVGRKNSLLKQWSSVISKKSVHNEFLASHIYLEIHFQTPEMGSRDYYSPSGPDCLWNIKNCSKDVINHLSLNFIWYGRAPWRAPKSPPTSNNKGSESSDSNVGSLQNTSMDRLMNNLLLCPMKALLMETHKINMKAILTSWNTKHCKSRWNAWSEKVSLSREFMK